MDLERLNKALSTYEVAEHIFKIDDGKTLSDCLKIGVEGQDLDPSTIAGAMKITRTKQLEALQPTASWKPKTITVGGNKTKTVFNGVSAKPDAPVKKFSSIVNKSTSDFNRLTAEDHIEDHRSANGELPWVKRKVSAAQVATVKRAALKSVENQRQCVEERQAFNVNETAMAILRRARDLKETNNTPAACTIVAHPLSGESSVKAQLQKGFSDSRLADATVQRNVADANDISIRMPELNTRERLPDDFKPKITPTIDQSFAAQTRAAKTLDRPKPEFVDTSKNDQCSISVNQPSVKVPTIAPPLMNGKSMGAETYKNHPEQEPRWNVSLSKPRQPVQNQNHDGSPYTGAI
jgi:hypothetical protein